jgi:hypothetical protein
MIRRRHSRSLSAMLGSFERDGEANNNNKFTVTVTATFTFKSHWEQSK